MASTTIRTAARQRCILAGNWSRFASECGPQLGDRLCSDLDHVRLVHGAQSKGGDSTGSIATARRDEVEIEAPTCQPGQRRGSG